MSNGKKETNPVEAIAEQVISNRQMARRTEWMREAKSAIGGGYVDEYYWQSMGSSLEDAYQHGVRDAVEFCLKKIYGDNQPPAEPVKQDRYGDVERKPSCSNCPHFETSHDDTHPKYDGVCLRYPPDSVHYTDGTVLPFFRSVTKRDRCGEHPIIKAAMG